MLSLSQANSPPDLLFVGNDYAHSQQKNGDEIKIWDVWRSKGMGIAPGAHKQCCENISPS